MSRRLRFESDAMPTANPIARAYFRAIGEPSATDVRSAPERLLAGSDEPAGRNPGEALAGDVEKLLDILLDVGIAQPPRALLAGSQEPAPRLGRIQDQMRFVLDHDRAVYAKRNEELAFLANTLMAGCSIQARPFTAQEAWDAAIAICNLGLENCAQTHDNFLVDHDLVNVFQVGWTVLHDDVIMYAAAQLVEALAHFQCGDREIQTGLDGLRAAMTKQLRAGAPWRARDALDVIASLDMPAWAVLLGLIGECPVIHAALAASHEPGTRTVSASAFEFISENSQIACVREFMKSLPAILEQ
jgi:hypothetical protein